MSNMFSSKEDYDSDSAILFFDADIQKILSEDISKNKIDCIKNGTTLEFGECLEDEDRLKEQNINYYLLHKINQIAKENLIFSKEELQSLRKKDKKKIISPGHNSTYSAQLLSLFGGYKPHIDCFEDIDLGNTIYKNINRAINQRRKNNELKF